jgi:hypothetical protein
MPLLSYHLLIEAMHTTVVIVLIATVGICSATMSTNSRARSIVSHDFRSPQQSVRLDDCITCLDAVGGSIYTLLYFIRDSSIASSCEVLCQAVADRSRSTDTGARCDLVCQATGIEKFVKIAQNADLDPIRYCQIAKLCPGRLRGYLFDIHIKYTLKQ